MGEPTRTAEVPRVARRLAWLFVMLAAALGLVVLPASAAATFHVTSSADNGDGDCQSAMVGDCTLRDAVDDATSGDSILIDPTYSPALSSKIVLDKSLTIIGQGVAMTTISGPGSDRVIEVTSGFNVTFSALTISGGRAPGGAAAMGNGGSGGAGADGGGILNAGTLQLINVRMSDNRAGDGAGGNSSSVNFVAGGDGGNGGSGGAISNSGALTITSSTLSGNSAGSGGGGGQGGAGVSGASGGSGGSGGAISNFGSGTIAFINSTLSGNSAGSGGGGGSGATVSSMFGTDGYPGGAGGAGGSGGAIATSGGAVTVRRSTLDSNGAGAGGRGGNGGGTPLGNTGGRGGDGGAGGPGGAISNGADLTIENSTLTVNAAGGGGDGGTGGEGSFQDGDGTGGAGGKGGGIATSTPTANATHATVVNNSAGGGGSPGGTAGAGGGLDGSISLANTLIVSNTCSGSPVDDGINLSFPIGSGCPDGSATDPQLGPLANNGGPTFTMKLAPTSAALDAIDTPCPLATDQRGVTRPQGQKCDVGAFELEYQTLTVTATGSGTIAGTGINCPSDCTESKPKGTMIALSPTPTTGFMFTGWSGACTGTGACTVTLDADKAVTATFAPIPRTLTVTVMGSGAVTGTGINCPTDCMETVDHGTMIPLTPTPMTGFTFTGWSGVCTGTGACTVTLDGDKAVTATFAPIPRTLTVTTVGSGTVTGTGISCPGDCAQTVDHGTMIALTATPAPGFTFSGWSGACTGTGACTVTLDADRAVTATFTAIPPPADTGGGPTGQRAAALKKCKKKKGRARANCKRKAKKLPV